MARIGVLGATSWGMTLAWLLDQASAAGGAASVTVLCRTQAEVQRLRHERSLPRLPEVRLRDAIAVEVAGAPGPLDGVVAAVPAQALRGSLAGLAVPRDIPILNAAKGIELVTGLRLSQVIEAAGWRPEDIAVVSGPNLAHEVARGLPAAAVVASTALSTAERWQHLLAGPTFRVYRSADVTGVELGGAAKNVIAIAAGAAIGLGFGANTVAALMTRGLAEMTRLAVALGAEPETLQGLAGLGDLAATCFSGLSRNHRLGELLAQGFTPAAALRTIGQAVEGAATAPALVKLANEAGVEAPISAEVEAVLAGRKSVGEAMASLLGRSLTVESG